METKGITPVKKDTLPIARYVASKVLDIVNSNLPHHNRKIIIRDFLGKVFKKL